MFTLKKSYKLFILTILALCSRVYQLSAQDIEGVPLGTVVDEEFIRQKFGQDYSKIVKKHSFGHSEVYVFGKDSLLVNSHHILSEVKLRSPRFAVNTKKVPGGIHVGQKADMLSSAKLDFCRLHEWNNSIYMEIPLWHNLGWYKLNGRREISSITMYEFFGDDVDGIGLGQKVTPELFISKFGKPDVIKTEEYWDEPMTVYVYYDGKLSSAHPNILPS